MERPASIPEVAAAASVVAVLDGLPPRWRGHIRSLFHRSARVRKKFSAGLLATTASLGANATVIVHPCVLLTLVGAHRARGAACFERGTRHVRVIVGVTGKNLAGGDAEVGAVEVHANAPNEFCDHLLAEAGISARGTDLRALEAGLDAAGESVAVEPDLSGAGV